MLNEWGKMGGRNAADSLAPGPLNSSLALTFSLCLLACISLPLLSSVCLLLDWTVPCVCLTPPCTVRSTALQTKKKLKAHASSSLPLALTDPGNKTTQQQKRKTKNPHHLSQKSGEAVTAAAAAAGVPERRPPWMAEAPKDTWDCTMGGASGPVRTSS